MAEEERRERGRKDFENKRRRRSKEEKRRKIGRGKEKERYMGMRIKTGEKIGRENKGKG